MSYKSNIWKLYAFKFFQSMHFMSGVLIPFFTQWAGISYFQITLLQTWFVLWYTVLEIPTGAVADYFGRKTSIFLGVFVVIFAAFVYSYKPIFYLFLLGEFLFALSGTLISGADQALLYDTLKELKREKESKKILARYGSFHMWGLFIAAPIGSIIGAKLGLNYAFMAMMIPFFTASIIALTIKEPKYKKEKETTRYLKVLLDGTKYFFKHRILRVLAFDSVSISALTFFVIWIYQPYLMELGLPLALIGVVHAGIVMSEILIMNNFKPLENLFGGKLNYIFYSSLLIGLCYILFSMTTNLYFGIILSLIVAGFGFTRKFLMTHYMNKYIESENRATVLSTVSMLGTFVKTIMYPIIGLLMEYSLNISLLILGILVIISSFFSRTEEHMLID